MKTITEHIRLDLLMKAGIHPPNKLLSSIEELAITQWNPEFERLMRNRLIMGAFRHGTFDSQVEDGSQFDSVESAKERLGLYQEGGNLERLVDAANLCLVEFTVGRHPKRHFEATDDGIHSKRIK
jgi:hypothetical protein